MIQCRDTAGREAPLGHRAGRPARLGTRVRSGRVVRRASRAAALILLATLAACQQFPAFDFPWMSGSDRNAGGTHSDGSSAARRELVGKVQDRLARLGYQPGPADGLSGPRTRTAVKRYQKDRRIKVDGKISHYLLAKLEKSLEAQAARRKRTGSGDAVSSRTPGRTKIAFPLSRAQLPSPEVGSTFVYSDGAVENIVGVKGTSVRWRRPGGLSYTADRNFLLPWSAWTSVDKRGTAEVNASGDGLWPLKSGEQIAFAAQVVIQTDLDSEALSKRTDHWNCRLDGKSTVTVIAGTFDTAKLICDRAAKPSVPAVTRVWYYAPDIRAYVRREQMSAAGDSVRRVDLVAIRPGGQTWPPLARAALARAIQDTLDSAEDGARESWSSSGLDIDVTIHASSRFQGLGGQACRRYFQTWKGPGGTRHYPAAACRDESGEWRIPGLDDPADGSLAVSGGLS